MMKILIAVVLAACASAHAQTPAPEIAHQVAARFGQPAQTMILASTRIGAHVVAVGDRGMVLLSDDDGKSYRQAQQVPTRATLTSVSFVDARTGWAAGHWGVILHTVDGGEHWRMQRDDRSTDQPLHAIWFGDKQHGIAAGLFSLLLRTEDGGASWTPAKLPAASGGKRADLNLFRLFPDRQGRILIVGEQGAVYRSADGGATWELLPTGSKGTLWTGLVLDDDSILVAGIRGKLLRSTDQGESWNPVDTGTMSSITDLVALPGGRVQAVGLDGVSLLSMDHGHSFTMKQRADQLPLTSVVANSKGAALMFSQSGVVRSD